MTLTMLLKLLPESALHSAVTAGWMSIGSLWTFTAGFTLMMALDAALG